MRRLLLIVLMAAACVGMQPGPAQATGDVPPDGDAAMTTTAATTQDTTTTTIDNSFFDTERNLTECLNNSVPLPGCGREPTQEGDRGGGLQLATFVLLIAGMGFIFWRVVRGVRSRDAALASETG